MSNAPEESSGNIAKTYSEILKEKRLAHLEKYRVEQLRQKHKVAGAGSAPVGVSRHHMDADGGDAVEIKAAAFKRLKGLYAVNQDQTDLSLARKEVDLLGIKFIKALDIIEIIKNFEVFSLWYKPDQEQHIFTFKQGLRFLKEGKSIDGKNTAELMDPFLKSEQEKYSLNVRIDAFARLKDRISTLGYEIDLSELGAALQKMRVAQCSPKDIRFIRQNLKDFIVWYDPEDYQYAFAFKNYISRENRVLNAARLTAALQSEVEKYAAVLQTKRARLVYKNEYGVVKGLDKWALEVIGFARDVFEANGAVLNEAAYSEVISMVSAKIDSLHGGGIDHKSTFQADEVAFEARGIEILRQAGWDISHPEGLHQPAHAGITVIASQQNFRVSLRFLESTTAIAEEAIKSAAEEMDALGCDYAVFVSNAPYTAAAVMLARTSGVVLADDLMLVDLSHWVGISS